MNLNENLPPGTPAPPAVDDPRVVEALDQYVQALEGGQKPNREAFLARHSDVAAPLAECLDGMEALHAASSASHLGGRTGPAVEWQPGTPLGDFRIVREIGRGGMGVVYEAVQLSLDRQIALKILPFALTLDPRQLQRFKNEARAAAQLHHQHIVPIYQVGCERSVHFYAMQYVEGKSLAEVIRELRWRKQDKEARTDGDKETDLVAQGTTTQGGGQKPEPTSSPPELAASLSPCLPVSASAFFRTVAQLGVQAAEALEHAHQYGVVHRDIKPGNLMVDVHGQLWVTDFGLAQFQSDTGLTLTGDLLGTLRYMSPEQALAKRGLVDHRTDIYSLGATLYELLTLEPAYGGRDREELLRQLAFEEPRPPRRVNPEMPPDLETILLKAIAKNLEDRYASARELADDLRRFLEYKPIKARRPTLLERGRKWVRRHQALVGTVVFVTVAALAVSTALVRAAYVRERQKANEAEESFRQARETVDFFTQLIEDELADKPPLPPLQELRRKALEKSLDYYQGFIDQRSDDPSLREELSASKQRVAKFLDELATMQGFGQILLLDNPRVLAELRLSDAQREQLGPLTAGFRAQQFGLFRGPEQRRKSLGQAAAYQQKVKALLNDDQVRRLKEIEFQSRGPMAFNDQDVIKALGLTPQQQAKIRQLQANSFGDHCDPPPPRGPHHPDDRKVPETGRPDLKAQILEHLTPAQQRQWSALTGKPFEGFGRGGPGRRGFGPPGGFGPRGGFGQP